MQEEKENGEKRHRSVSLSRVTLSGSHRESVLRFELVVHVDAGPVVGLHLLVGLDAPAAETVPSFTPNPIPSFSVYCSNSDDTLIIRSLTWVKLFTKHLLTLDQSFCYKR